MIKLKSILENLRSDADDYYYHVTLALYLSSIKKYGLKIKTPNATVSNYKDYSKGKIFLCDSGNLNWWIDKIAEHAFHQFDNEYYHNLAIFKILKSNLRNVKLDRIGYDDSLGGSYYITNDIPPSDIEFVKIEYSPY